MSKEKLSYIDYFRAIAIIFIVLGHTICWGSPGSFIKTTNIIMFRGGTFAFVFIAGFLFQYLSYKFNYWEYLKKKFNNVLMPYLITITPAALLLAFTLNIPEHYFYKYNTFTRLISCYLGGMVIQTPVWFVWMIVIFFLIAPVLLYFKKNDKLWYTVLAISFICTIFMKRPMGLTYSGVYVMYLSFASYYFRRFLFFSFAYLFGMEMCTIIEKHKEFIKKHCSLFLAILVPIYILLYFIYLDNYNFLNLYQTLPKMVSVLIILFFLIKFEEKIKAKAFLDKALKFIANYSFGIFFIHFYFINLLTKHSLYKIPLDVNYWVVSKNTFGCFLNAVVLFLVSFLGSIAVLFVLKKLLNKLGIENTRRFIGV